MRIVIVLKVLIKSIINLTARSSFLPDWIEAAIQKRVSFMPLVAVFVEEDFFYGKNASMPRQCPGKGTQVENVLHYICNLGKTSR